MTKRYWFARRKEGQGPLARLALGRYGPVTWEGYASTAAPAALAASGASMWMDARSQGVEGGWIGFVLLMTLAAGLYTVAVKAKSDPDHTVADYKSGRVNTNSDGSKNA